MISCHDIEEVETRIRAGWHVEDDCCDNCSGQRKRYLRIENERLASLNRPQAHGTGCRGSERTPCSLSGRPSSTFSDSRLDS